MHSLNLTDYIGVLLIVADDNVIFISINRQSVLQKPMQMLNIFFCNRLIDCIKNIIKALEMIGCFNDIINVSNAFNSMRFKNIARLIVR